MEFLLGGISACGACLFTNPLEVVKIRLQLQGELASKGVYTVHYKNPLQAIYRLAKAESIFALQKGLVPALWYQLCMNGTRLGTFHLIEERGMISQQDGKMDPIKTILAGAMAGSIGAFVGSPLYLVKTHLQSHSSASIAVGYQHHHKGMWEALRSIHKQHGTTGLWRGALASLPRVSVGSASQLATFTKSRELISQLNILPKDSWLIVLASSMVSGVVVALLMTPFDVVSTRIYNQGVDAKGRGLTYTGVPDCLMKIVRSEGPLGLYKGLLANYLRLGPHSVLSLMFWTQLRKSHKSYTALTEEAIGEAI